MECYRAKQPKHESTGLAGRLGRWNRDLPPGCVGELGARLGPQWLIDSLPFGLAWDCEEMPTNLLLRLEDRRILEAPWPELARVYQLLHMRRATLEKVNK